VRDASTVGQIVACPKCRSMVMVESPHVSPLLGGLPKAAAPSPAGDPSAPRARSKPQRYDSQENTVSGSYDDLNPTRLTEEHPQTARDASNADTLPELETEPPLVPVSPSAGHSSAPALVSSASLLPPGPASSFDAPQVRRFRQIMMVAAAAVLGSLLAILVFGYLGSRWGRLPKTASTSPSSGGVGEAQPDTGSQLPGPPPSDLTPNTGGTPDGVASRDITGNAVGDAAGGTANGSGTASGAEPVANKAANDAAQRTAAEGGPEREPENPAIEPGRRRDVTADGPGSGRGDDPEPGAEPAGDPTAEPLPKGNREQQSPFGEFSDIIQSRTGQANPQRGLPERTRPNGLAARTEGSEQSALPRPEPREVDVEARLADRLVSYRQESIPLAEFAVFITQWSTIPIVFDWDALRLRHVAADASLTINAPQPTTIGRLLEAVLKPHHLGLRTDDGVVTITFSEEWRTESKVERISLDDLLSETAAEADAVLEWIKMFAAPQSWDDRGGDGTLAIENRQLVVGNVQAVIAEVAFLCDQMRAARGLKGLHYSNEEVALFHTPWRDNARLAAPVTLNYVRPTRWFEILRRLGADSQTTIVVDWRGVAEAGWNPAATIKFTTDGKPLQEAIQAMVGPMELSYRVADLNTIVITSSRTLSEQMIVDVFPLQPLLDTGDDAERILERVRMAVDPLQLRENGGGGEIVVESSGAFLWARLPYAQMQVIGELLIPRGDAP